MRAAGCRERDFGFAVGTFLCSGSCCRSGFLHLVDRLDNQEHDKCNNDEINHRVEKCAIIQSRHTGILGSLDGSRIGAAQVDEEVSKINAAQQLANGRHHHIIDKGSDNLAKCATNHDTNGEVNQIARIANSLNSFNMSPISSPVF